MSLVISPELAELIGEDDLELDYWRFGQLRALGVGVLSAVMLVSKGRSHHEVQDLIERGCPVETAVEILS